MHLDRYELGRLVVDGREVRSDVLISGGHLREHWGRREGHALCLDDLGTVLDEQPKRLVIGTGAYGRMCPEPGLEAELAASGIAVEVLETAVAVDRVTSCCVSVPPTGPRPSTSRAEKGGDVNIIEEWVEGHDAPLEEIARDTQLPTRLVHLAAVLVLEGLPDHEIYDLLREHLVSMDGEHNPLEGAPLALAQIRRLAAS